MTTLEAGKHYWMRHHAENIWRPCYVIASPRNGDDKWLDVIGEHYFVEVARMNLADFDFVEIPAPDQLAATKSLAAAWKAKAKEYWGHIKALRGPAHVRAIQISERKRRLK